MGEVIYFVKKPSDTAIKTWQRAWSNKHIVISLPMRYTIRIGAVCWGAITQTTLPPWNGQEVTGGHQIQ